MLKEFRLSSATRRTALTTVAPLALAVFVASPAMAQGPDRAGARALHKEAKALRSKGDLDGAAKLYLQAHDMYAGDKVAKWLSDYFDKTGKKVEHAAFLEKIIAEKRPAASVKWATDRLAPIKAEVEKLKAEEEAKKKAEAEAAKKKAEEAAAAKAAADAQAKAAAEAAAKADAAQQAAELERLKASATEEARARIQAEYDERDQKRRDAEFLPKQLLYWGMGVGVVGLVGYSVMGVGAADKRTDAAKCFSDFLQHQSCSATEYAAFDKEAEDADDLANVSLMAAGIGLITAVVGGVLLWRAGADADEAGAADGGGAEGSAGDLFIAPGLGGASVIGTF